MLVEYLNQKQTTKFMRFPNRVTQIGQAINAYLTNATELDDHVVHLLFSANRWEAAEELKSYLSNGFNVVVDRYSYSGAAFSAAKPGLTLAWCMQPEYGLPKPDAVIYLDLPIEQAMARAEFGEERYEKQSFQENVRENFFTIMKSQSPPWRVLDASKSIKQLHHEVKEIAEECIETAKNNAIGVLGQ